MNHKKSDESNSIIFLYVVIIVICLFLSKFFNITLSTILFLIIAIIIIFYIHNNKVNNNNNKEIVTANNLFVNLPKPKNMENFSDLDDFIHSIQKYNQYNANAFDEIVSSIYQFVDNYNKIIDNPIIYCGQDLLTTINFARNAKNNLQSMIYKIPSDKSNTDELHKHMQTLDMILNNYVYNLNKLCYDTSYISFYGPKPYNFYDNSKWNQFEFY
ncbi:putative ORFan [Tupanvirus deep ocean]|uniref:ORFan n=2 Tax=Tupanvirus TaxID=2094720 RepID=A0AC62A7Y4_9VIRU|nr:putative ORFan [Tupanvirus deep ocean]QKU33892.1 putative ORFan [Tupanvirus deep ocean]